MFLESLVSHSALLLSPAGQQAAARLGPRGRLLLTRCVRSVVLQKYFSSFTKKYFSSFTKIFQ